MGDGGALARGAGFLRTHARLLERRVYERVFAGAAEGEWRGKWTLDALRTLRAYGRI